MAIPILNELNDELTRLFAAGSRLAAEDPRIKKHLPALKKLGEKAPVFAKIGDQLEQLLTASPEATPKKLIEAKTLLLSVLNTQGETKAACELSELEERQAKLGSTAKTYKQLSPILDALRKSGYSRMETLKNALAEGLFEDPRLLKSAALAITDGNHELVNYLIDSVYPAADVAIYEYIEQDFDLEGKSADALRLRAMYRLKGKDLLSFVEDCQEKGGVAVRVEAINLLSAHKEYEDLLLSLLEDKKAIKEAALHALLNMQSEKGINRAIAMLSGKDAKLAREVLPAHSGSYLANEALALAKNSYQKAKDYRLTAQDTEDSPDRAQKAALVLQLHQDMNLLANKEDQNIAIFLSSMLEDGGLEKLDKALSKEEQMKTVSLYSKTLNLLYHTGYGFDVIWNRFEEAQKSDQLGKLFNNRRQDAELLLLYAYRIGITRLDPECFFDTFFESGLFESIQKADSYLFESCLKKAEEAGIAPSKRLAEYFATHGQFSRALQVLYPDDQSTIKKLIARFNQNMTNKSFRYNYINYEILEFVGKHRLPEFKDLYELYSQKYPGSNEGTELAQYLN